LRTGPDMSDFSTWREVLADVTAEIGDAREARWLCEDAAGADAAEFDLLLDDAVTMRMGIALRNMVARRMSGEPLQYVLGHWSFRRLDVMVDRRVLIPRPETERLVDLALDTARGMDAPRVIADLGTGSGVIALSLAAELPLEGTTVLATDVSTDALDVARANLAGIGRAAVNVSLWAGDWCAALPAAYRGAIDVIVANPPYIAVADPAVEAIVVDHEPHTALYSGADGLDAIRTIVAQAPHWLSARGRLLLEIGHEQADAVRAMLAGTGWREVTVHADLTGRDRFVTAHAPTGASFVS
jgi:release factor glutamine methyltransferase